MRIGEVNLRLTKHGRARYLKRVCDDKVVPDKVILATAWKGAPGFRFIWSQDSSGDGSLRLVTVLEKGWKYQVPPNGKET